MLYGISIASSAFIRAVHITSFLDSDFLDGYYALLVYGGRLGCRVRDSWLDFFSSIFCTPRVNTDNNE